MSNDLAVSYAEKNLGKNYDLVLRISSNIQNKGFEFPEIKDYASMNAHIEDHTPKSAYDLARKQQTEIIKLWTPIQSQEGTLSSFLGGGNGSSVKSSLEDFLKNASSSESKKNAQSDASDLPSALTNSLLGSVQSVTKNSLYALAIAVGKEYSPADIWEVLEEAAK